MGCQSTANIRNSRIGMTKEKAVHRFNIIRTRNPKHVVLANGMTIRKQEDQKFWIPEYQGFVPAAPYGNHFIFEIPKEIKNVSTYMCSCGSPAIAVGSTAYAHLGSAEGLMLVCMMHTDYNRHSDGSE